MSVLAVLLRLAYLTVRNTFAILRLLAASDRGKAVAILTCGIWQRDAADDASWRSFWTFGPIL